MIFPETTFTLFLYWPALGVGEWDHGGYPVSEVKRPILTTATPLDAAREIRTALLAYLQTVDEDSHALNCVAPKGLYGRNWQNADILIESNVLTKTTRLIPSPEEAAVFEDEINA